MRPDGTIEEGTKKYRFQVGGGDIQQGGNTGLFYGISQLREMWGTQVWSVVTVQWYAQHVGRGGTR